MRVVRNDDVVWGAMSYLVRDVRCGVHDRDGRCERTKDLRYFRAPGADGHEHIFSLCPVHLHIAERLELTEVVDSSPS